MEVFPGGLANIQIANPVGGDIGDLNLEVVSAAAEAIDSYLKTSISWYLKAALLVSLAPTVWVNQPCLGY